MKKSIGIVFLIVGIIITAVCGFYSVGLISAFLSPDVKKAHSIGIIGGADGPTAVFVTSDSFISPWSCLIGIVVGVAAIVGSVIAIRKNKSKK